MLLPAPVALLGLCSLMPLLMRSFLCSQPRLLRMRTLLGLLLGHQALVAIKLDSLCFLLLQKAAFLMADACGLDVTLAQEPAPAMLSTGKQSRATIQKQPVDLRQPIRDDGCTPGLVTAAAAVLRSKPRTSGWPTTIDDYTWHS